MFFSISRWRPLHLLGAWAAYWVTLVLVTLGPAMLAASRVLPEDAKGNISAAFGNAGASLTVMNGGTTAWSGTASFSALAWWIAGPPLLIWLAWLFTRPRRAPLVSGAAEHDALRSGEGYVRSSPHPPVHEKQPDSHRTPV